MSRGELAAMLPRAGPALLEVTHPAPGFVALLPARGRRRVALLDRLGRCRVVAARRLAVALRAAAGGGGNGANDGNSGDGGNGGDGGQAPVGRELRRAGRARHPAGGRGARRAAGVAGRRGGVACRGRHRQSGGTCRADGGRPALGRRRGVAGGCSRDRAPPGGEGRVVVRQQLFARLVRRGGSTANGAQKLAGEGTGLLLGRMLAGEALESAELAGLPAALFAGLDLAVALAFLRWGAAPRLHIALFCAAAGVWAALAATVRRRRRDLVADSLRETHGLVEKLAGQRTRRVQEHPRRRFRAPPRGRPASARADRRSGARRDGDHAEQCSERGCHLP